MTFILVFKGYNIIKSNYLLGKTLIIWRHFYFSTPTVYVGNFGCLKLLDIHHEIDLQVKKYGKL